MALGVATGGGSAVAQAVSLGYLAASAAGNGAEEAFQSGANYWQGMGYGAASGVVEAATEKMFGGGTRALYGAGAFDAATKGVAKTGVHRVLGNAVEEGVEEMTSELVNPLLRSIYDPEAYKQFLSKQHVQDILTGGAVGAATSVAYGETFGRFTGDGGKGGDVRNIMAQVNDLQQLRTQDSVNGKLTQSAEAKINQSIVANYNKLQSLLRSATQKQRNRLISANHLSGMFNADGTMRSDFADRLGKLYNGTSQKANAAEAAAYYKYTSANLHGRESAVDADLAEISKQFQAGNDGSAPAFAVYQGDLTADEQANYTDVKRFVSEISRRSGTDLGLVVIGSNNYINGTIHNGTMYLTKDALASGNWASTASESWMETAVHEGTHVTFGTQKSAELLQFLAADEDLLAKVGQEMITKGYVGEADIAALLDKEATGQTLTADEQATLAAYTDEALALMADEVLGNKRFIQRFTKSRRSRAQRVLDKIGEIKDAFARIGNADAKREYRRFVKAEQLWSEALDELGATVVNGKIVLPDDDEESGTEDLANGTRFSLKGTDSDGMEIYETSEDIRSLSNAEKRKLFVQQMRNEYRGRTAKFTVDGETYYARFAYADVQKLAYGDKNSDTSGNRAKLNAEASGDIFDLVENATYWSSSSERGKNIRAHKSVVSWDYFVKTVQIDGVRYNEVINVRKTGTNEYVYDVSLNEKVVPSPSGSAKSVLISSEETTSANSIRKNSENVNTSSQNNVKFSRKDADGHKTHYRKSDVDAILNAVTGDLAQDAYLSVKELAGKTRDEIVAEFQSKINATPEKERLGVALELADFIVNNATAESLYDAMDADEVAVAKEQLATLRKYLHKLDLSGTGMKAEIKYRYDSDRSKIYLRWAHSKQKGGTSLQVDQIADELRAGGISINSDTEYDMLAEINDAYEHALDKVRNRTTRQLTSLYTEDELQRLKTRIARDILLNLDKKGVLRLGEIEAEYDAKLQPLRREVHNLKRILKATGSLERRLHTLQGLKTGAFVRSTDYRNTLFDSTIGKLTQLRRGDYRRESVRDIIADFAQWYNNDQNPIKAEYVEWKAAGHSDREVFPGMYQQDVSGMLTAIAEGTGELSAYEVEYLDRIVANVNFVIQHFNKVRMGNKWVDAVPIVQDYVTKAQNAAKLSKGGAIGWLSNRYMKTFGDPATVCRMMDCYQNGFFTEMFELFRDGQIGAGY